MEIRYEAAFIPTQDITVVFTHHYIDNTDEIISTEVTGFYFGEPNEADTKTFRNTPIAYFNVEKPKTSTDEEVMQRVIKALMKNDPNGTWDECTTIQEVRDGITEAMFTGIGTEVNGFYNMLLDILG